MTPTDIMENVNIKHLLSWDKDVDMLDEDNCSAQDDEDVIACLLKCDKESKCPAPTMTPATRSSAMPATSSGMTTAMRSTATTSADPPITPPGTMEDVSIACLLQWDNDSNLPPAIVTPTATHLASPSTTTITTDSSLSHLLSWDKDSDSPIASTSNIPRKKADHLGRDENGPGVTAAPCGSAPSVSFQKLNEDGETLC
ncbi:hypothetical protein WOLCODRAFT_20640 [Wolfiporia cocos MD-104 SS10]|uniref:Uncharacterized protein n=1 Tax=Wolfiporia cocos (strain MD-104) TaxID=742152 RepID=A0A2H3J374_WOLCO|nr:hypothetical protein WOLCODRAFT_20640 [Wolfiporia cocos MD-104 SS10]